MFGLAINGLARTPQRRAAMMAAVTILSFAAPHRAEARGPENFSDLADQVTNAVVNISASTTVEARDRTMPQVPPGSPFDELFDEFFKRRGGDGAQPRTRKSNSLGSGFIVDPAGVVVTNAHVIGDANEIFAILNDGTKLKAEIIGKDSKLDLAVLRVKPDKPLSAVKFGDSEKLRVGEWVIAVGNPFGLGGSVSAGIVSAINRNIEQGPYDSYVQTDAAINKGNSGGPLFNLDGEVIGINTAILSPTGGSVGIGFAVPSALAAPVVEQLREFGETHRGWLGVKIQTVDDATAEALNLGRVRGALVAGVDEKGPAKAAGIEVGDVIVKLGGRDVTARDLPRVVAAMPVGKAVDVVVVRKGAELNKAVTLGRLSEEDVKQATLKSDADKDIDKPAVKSALGLDLVPLNDETRKRYSIKPTVKGVVVSKVDPNSNAADKRIQAGEVIVEVGQEAVLNPADVTRRIEAIKKDGKKSALLLIANAQGEVRFVALPIE